MGAARHRKDPSVKDRDKDSIRVRTFAMADWNFISSYYDTL